MLGDGVVDLVAWGTEDCTFTLTLSWDLRFKVEVAPDIVIDIDITEVYSDYSVTLN